jgi:molybdopterin converting factor small subunit
MKKANISVHVKVAGFIEMKMTTAEFDLAVPEGTSIKELFTLVDKSGQLKGKAMKKMLAALRPPTVLHNGRGLDVPEELKTTLAAGDEIAIMTPMSGG